MELAEHADEARLAFGMNDCCVHAVRSGRQRDTDLMPEEPESQP